MNGNRGAKGSINDRLISMMYRNRYKKWKLKRSSYRTMIDRKEQKVYLNTIKDFDIDDGINDLELTDQLVVEEAIKPIKNTLEEVPLISKKQVEINDIESQTNYINQKENLTVIDSNEMHKLSDKIIEFDPKEEDYDFDRYDYYEVIQTRTKVGTINEDEIIDPKKEINIKDNEITVIEELNDFINDGKEKLTQIKEEITEVKELISSAKTQDELVELEIRMNRLRREISELKNKYNKIKDHYDLSEFIILDSITYMDAIISLNDEASVEQLEVMVDVCKEEIESINSVVIENNRGMEAKIELTQKKNEIEKRDHDFIDHRTKVENLNKEQHQISERTDKQLRTLKEIKDHLYDYEIEVVKVTKIVNKTQSVFGSFLRIATGILTKPLSNVNIFGIMLGTHMINKGLRGLRSYINPEIVTIEEKRKKYRDMEFEISKSKDYVSNTKNLLSDSMWQLDQLEQEFQTRFDAYADAIPEYKQVFDQIRSLRINLNQKEQELNLINKDLDRQYEANKIKIKKAS